jgi:hypothetical protein
MCYLKRKTRLRGNKYGQLLIPTQRIHRYAILLGNEYIEKPLLRKRNTGRIVEFPQERDTLFNDYSTVLNG